MKTLITSLLILIANLSFSQEYLDILIDENSTTVFCNIQQIKKGKVKFRQKGKSYSEVKDISNFTSIDFNGKDVIKNPLNIKIEKPEKGYSYIYFYAANDRFYKVMQNKKKVVKINKYSYYLYKVEANKTYELYCLLNPHEEDHLVLDAKDGEIYIVKAMPGRTTFVENIFHYHYSNKLVIDNSELSKLALLTMTKKRGK